MKLKLLCAAAVLTAAFSASFAYAQETVPTVTVNDNIIHFEELDPYIENDVTMVPIRSVFRAMNCKVKWIPEKLQVQIDSNDNMTRALLTLGEAQMKVYHFENMWHSTETAVDLQTPMQIINDKTAIPLRAVAEAMDAKVEWDENEAAALITTADKPVFGDDETTFYITADKDEVKKDDELNIYLNVKNFAKYENTSIANVSLGLYYDPTKFELVENHMIDENGAELSGLDASNGEFLPGLLKFVCLTTEFDKAMNKDGKIAVLKLKALSDEGCEFTISRGYMASRSYDSMVGIKTEDGLDSLSPENAVFDTTPLVIK